MRGLNEFFAGMATMGFLLAGLFFFRFYARTRDPLFSQFGFAFCLLAANQAVITLSGFPPNELGWAYALRVMAFAMLIYGIVRKNFNPR
jgi:hypothetical protein